MLSLIEQKNKAKRRPKKSKYNSISYTTGNIGLNIDHFNQRMGTYDAGGISDATSSTDSSVDAGGGLCEAKRYVRRYYIRPQNIFCSNKAEIIKALIELDDANCSIYTLNNLGDEKDVSKLMNSDIIYYYDDGILYDKNKVKVMDYDLSIKKEENRKHFANVEKASDKEFKNAYEDRMTDATELEEDVNNQNNLGFSIEELKTFLTKTDCPIQFGESEIAEDACSYVWEIDETTPSSYDNDNAKFVVTGWGYNYYTEEDGIEKSEYFETLEDAYDYMVDIASDNSFERYPITDQNVFNLDFDDIDVYGNKLTESKEDFCCICGEHLNDYGNNPEPYCSSMEGRCCDACNFKFVIPSRMALYNEEN